jgi:hypothetical protein
METGVQLVVLSEAKDLFFSDHKQVLRYVQDDKS